MAELTIKIELADYQKIAAQFKRAEVSVEEKEIEHALKWLQKSRAKFSQINRACQKGDFIEIEYTHPTAQEPVKDKFILGKAQMIPGFEDQIVGLKANEEKEFTLAPPADKKHLFKDGTDPKFKVKVLSVQKMELPEINDEFAKSLGNFQDLNALKTSVKQGIKREKQTAENNKRHSEMIKGISNASKFEIPNKVIELERDRMLENLKQEVKEKFQADINDYLKATKKTEEGLKKDLLAEAESRIKNSLVLEEVAKKQGIMVSNEEAEAQANQMLKNYPDQESAKKDINLDKARIYAKEAVRNRKVLEKLDSFISQNV